MQTGDTPKYLDRAELSTPVVALARAAREVLGVGDLIEKMLLKVSETLQPSSLHLDILRDLKRISAHIVSVAHPIMDEQRLLGESRLIVKVLTD